MLGFLRYNRIKQRELLQIYVYSNEFEIPKLSKILDCTVAFYTTADFRGNFSRGFSRLPNQRSFIWLASDTQTKEVDSIIFHRRRPPAGHYGVTFLAKRRAS